MTSSDHDQSTTPDPAAVPVSDDGTEEHEGVEVDTDTQSDPSLDDHDGSEWADEGGATDDGPATDT